MFTPSIFIAPRSPLARVKDSTGMADLKRKVITLSGGGVKPLRLEAVASARPSERVELRETRPSGKTLQKRILPVNVNRLSFDFKPPEGKLIKKPKLGFDQLNSTTEYNEFMVFDQGGTATIGSSNTRENFLVAIKRRKVSACIPTNHWKHQVHDNIVSLFELFYEGNEFCMIYEQMDVSLRHLTGTCEGQWDDYKIGAICKEIGSIARLCFKPLTSCRLSIVFSTFTMNVRSITALWLVTPSYSTGTALSKLVGPTPVPKQRLANVSSKHR